MTDYTYFVSGKVYARLAGQAEPFKWPGLVDNIQLAIQQQIVQLPDRTQPGGGVYKEIRRIQSMQLTINHREVDPTTLARALFGESTSVPAATVSDEQHTAYPGGFVPLDKPGAYTDVSVTDDATSPNTLDTDNYEVVAGGLEIPEDAPDIDTDGTVIKVTYTHPAFHRIQALVESAPELELIFVGRNEARDDKEVRVRLHKVRLGAAAALALLSGDDFGALELQGEVLKDTSKNGTTVSQYFFEEIV